MSHNNNDQQEPSRRVDNGAHSAFALIHIQQSTINKQRPQRTHDQIQTLLTIVCTQSGQQLDFWGGINGRACG